MRELVEFLVRELVDDPDAVSVTESSDERGTRYHVSGRDPTTWAR